MLRPKLFLALLASALSFALFSAAQQRPLLTLDEFFNSVEIHAVKTSPDGHAVIIETVRPDWEGNRFRKDLWLYSDEADQGGSLVQLTQSGHDSNPEWSPDGRWIAFLSDRQGPSSAEGNRWEGEGMEEQRAKPVAQLYLISARGGEAFPVTHGEEEVHAFAWSADSRLIYFATRISWTKEQGEAYRKQWKDVIHYRESERGDSVRSADINEAVAPAQGSGPEVPAHSIATIRDRIKQLAISPDGRRLAFLTDSRSQRQESLETYAIYLINSPGSLSEAGVVRIEQAQAIFEEMQWAPDSRHLFFSFLNGSVEGQYQDAQPRVYWVDVDSVAGNRGQPNGRWASRFPGAITGYAVTPQGALLAAGRLGTEVQPYSQAGPSAEFQKEPGWAGTYEHFSTARRSPRVAFVYSSLEQPSEVYLAEGLDKLPQARPITHFNRLFTERALPQGKPYRWMADDGTTIEGMLIYPPGKLGAKNLRLLTLIHGGPEDADGNRFEADWYQWSALAATNGWLVFEPNYRGSIGYGDQFALGVIIQIVSRPGKDILEGIDALVKDGIGDPEHLAIGGYSYGGYLTNWLITQTTRFKAAVSGAGAIEHAANWGNDDTTFDDAYFLGGAPWEAENNYNREAALWQFSKVRTPTHVVGGAEDIRVYVGEDYLLERALHTLGVPTSLLIFPGEGHSLDKNPWHGKIKVREELKWLERYGGK